MTQEMTAYYARRAAEYERVYTSPRWQEDLSEEYFVFQFAPAEPLPLDRRAPVDWALHDRHGLFRYGGTIRDLIVESGPFAPDMSFAER